MAIDVNFKSRKRQGRIGELVSDNFYWLSAKEDTLDWKRRQDTVYTPQAEFADLTGLEGLPDVHIAQTSGYKQEKGKVKVEVTLKNSGSAVAFMVRARLVDAKGDDVVPVFWSDNYISLLPGESRTIFAEYSGTVPATKEPGIRIDGWNVASN